MRKGIKSISFFGKKLNNARSNYSATQLELLAAIESLNHFKPYLMFRKFILRTDHRALLALKNTKSPVPMLFKWSFFPNEFDYGIEYIKGEQNPANTLSRLKSNMVASIKSQTIVFCKKIKENLIMNYLLYHTWARNPWKYDIQTIKEI